MFYCLIDNTFYVTAIPRNSHPDLFAIRPSNKKIELYGPLSEFDARKEIIMELEVNKDAGDLAPSSFSTLNICLGLFVPPLKNQIGKESAAKIINFRKPIEITL